MNDFHLFEDGSTIIGDKNFTFGVLDLNAISVNTTID
jgi:hypothetical protein